MIIVTLSGSESDHFQVGLQIFLILICMSIPFAIRNTRVAGVLLLIVPTISFGIAFSTSGMAQVVGYILFLIAGIMALIHKDDNTKKKRKAFTIILGFIDKVNSVNEWNERLHELHIQLKHFENVLPYNIQYMLNKVTVETDLRNMREQVSRHLYKLGKDSITKDIKVATVLVTISLLSMTTGTNLVNLQELVVPPIMGSDDFFNRNFDNAILSIKTLIWGNQSATSEHENQVPVASAGRDLIGNELEKITLDGSGSHDTDGDLLKYTWKKLEGPRVSIDNKDQNVASFVAPDVKDDDSLIFQLTVSDANSQQSDKVKVTIRNLEDNSGDNDNITPMVTASSDPKSVSFDVQDTNCNDSPNINLHAEAHDTDGNIIAYRWEQTKGQEVQLSTDDSPDVSFITPCIEEEISFRITVEDNNGGTATDETSVDVSGYSTPEFQPLANNPPTVMASAEPKSITYSYCVNIPTVTLHAAGSADGKIVSYQWEQIGGTKGRFLSGQTLSDVSFEPRCDNQNQEISFSVTVKDDKGASAKDETSVVINYQVP